MDSLEIELKLTVAQINAILANLAKGPYAEVSDVITQIRAQALPQVNAASKSQPDPAPDSDQVQE